MTDKQVYKYLIKLDNEIIMCVDGKKLGMKYIREKSEELKKNLDDGQHEIFEYAEDGKITLCTKSKGTYWDGTKKPKHVLTLTPVQYIEKIHNCNIDWKTTTKEKTEENSNDIFEEKIVDADISTLTKYISLKINNNKSLNTEEKSFMVEILENLDNPDDLMGIYYKHLENLEEIYLSKCY